VLKFITAENKIWKALRERTAKENGVGASDRRVLVIAFIANSKLGYLTKEKRGTTPLSYGQPHCIVWGMLLLTFPLYCLGNVITFQPWVSSTFDWQLAVQPVVSTNI
jgi:hypothetical protein